MKIIGICGGIGSGKSFICDLFKNESVPIFNFDEESKKLYQLDNVIDKMLDLFGEDIFDWSNPYVPIIIKHKLANIIFNEDLKRVQLEKLLKPELMQVFYEKMYHYEYIENQKLVIVESATMVKTGLYKIFDNIIIIDADLKDRKEKTIKNRGISSEDFDNRVKMQLTTQEILETIKNMNHIVFKNEYIDEISKKFVLDCVSGW